MAKTSSPAPGGIRRRLSIGNGANGSAPAASQVSERLLAAAKGDNAHALALLETSPGGLTAEQVEERVELYGLNEIARDKPAAWYIQLGQAFLNPFIGVLAVLILASLFLDVLLASPEDRSFRVIIVLSAMILVSALIRFWQEYRSSRAAEQLKAMVRTTATVIRQDDGGKRELPLSELVPGDVIQLAAGDMIPADVRLLTSKDLYVSQAILTGEALPVEKYDTLGAVAEKSAAGAVEEEEYGSALEIPRICLMGTSVSSGMATAVVVATGSDTYFGSMARSLVGARAMTSFDRGITSVSWLLIRFMLVMVPIVFIINGITKHDWLQALLFAMSVAVGLTPEMLPVMVTGNLARGALQMAKRKSIVKRLNSIQNFGAMDILCTDKTGTLTQDRIILEQHLDVHGDESERVLEYAYLNAAYQTGLKNLLDVAVIDYARENQRGGPDIAYHKVDEVPFDFLRRRLSVIVEADADQHLLVCKGAVEEVLNVCTAVEDHGQVVPLCAEMRDEVNALADDLSTDGLRVLAVGYREFPGIRDEYHLEDEADLTLLGCITFLDPPKETAGPAIAALKEHGVSVKILTGDSELVTRKVCNEVGLPPGDVLVGTDIERMTDIELAEILERTTVLAKLSPTQKSRVVRALQRDGHTVGYLGDGINDAPALRDADVGISVDTGADIAKESADIILLEKSLLVLEEGVILGRSTFGNIIKYIKMTASSNFGNMFSVLGSSVILPFLPMLPIQLVVLDFTYHVSQLSIPWDSLDEEYLKVPRKWNASDIGRFMVCIGPISSIFDYTTFALLWFVYHANTPAHQSLFQSGWFVESLLTQTLIVHMIRTQKIPFIQSTASAPVLLMTTLAMAAGLILPFTGLGASIGMQPLPLSFFPWLIGTLLAYCGLTQILKMVYIRRFGAWL
jgi:P-type Mg2+ transporter